MERPQIAEFTRKYQVSGCACLRELRYEPDFVLKLADITWSPDCKHRAVAIYYVVTYIASYQEVESEH